MKYNEAELKKTLDALPNKLRVAFALLCAERLAPAYVPFSKRNGRNPEGLASLLERLWQDLEGREMSKEDVQARLDQSLDLVPDEDEIWIGLPFYAGDAAAAVAYAFSVRLTGDSQDAAWAARRAYEALDHFVIHKLGINFDIAGAEEQVVMDPIIQRELGRQRRDLEELRLLAQGPLPHGILSTLRRKAIAEAYNFLVG